MDTRKTKQWNCAACTYLNEANANGCVMCGNKKQLPMTNKWQCKQCTFHNGFEVSRCVICNQSNKTNEKKNNDNDEDNQDADTINDGYKHVKLTNKLLPSDYNRSKQNKNKNKEKTKIEIMNKLMLITRSEETDKIRKCIGQITISYDGTDNYYYGTGTVYKQLEKRYYLVITCAHNLVRYDDIKNEKVYARKLFFLPNGIQEQNNRMVCINWMAHKKYNADIKHCSYDIGIILCYDSRKYYTKSNIDVNKFARIDNW
eukprot:131369_1